LTGPDKRKGGVVKYAVEKAVFRPTLSGMDVDLKALAGENPCAS
jgi:hypothetical protein